jgi:hypothetical protein
MKLGEALTLRSELQTRFQQIRERLKASVLIQEGENPPEDSDALLRELESLASQLEILVAQINRTNLATKLPDGRTVTDALARRDNLTILHSALQQVADAASERSRRYGQSEIRVLRTVDVGALRTRADELARERRELDVQIQESNWQTEIIDTKA